MDATTLRQMRAVTGMTQAAFADAMGLPRRTYEDLEGGKSTVRPIHVNAANWALIKVAAAGICTLPDDIKEVIQAAL